MIGIGCSRPRNIAAQIVSLVVPAVVLFQLASIAAVSIMDFRARREVSDTPAMVECFGRFVRILDHLPTGSRKDGFEAMQFAYPRLRLALLSPQQANNLTTSSQEPASLDAPRLLEVLRSSTGPDFDPLLLSAHAERGRDAAASHATIAVRLADRSVVTAELPAIDWPPPRPHPLFLVLLPLGLITTMSVALLWWAARALTAPLTRFATAAADFSLDRGPAPLPEDDGPAEVRAVARALNHMQARVRKSVEDRTKMLAAVSHDLRTPITRMRLRSEFIEQPEIRSEVLRDLDQMNGMVHAALSYLRDGQHIDAPTLIDIASLLEVICNDFSAIGAQVTFEGPQRLLIRAYNSELQRAVTNLLDNALKYGGGRAVVRLQPDTVAGTAVVEVIDSGPGIAVGLKEVMLAPFARGHVEHGMQLVPTGFGLGLAIAQSAAKLHEGELLLLDAVPHGLIARLILPMRAENRQSEVTKTSES